MANPETLSSRELEELAHASRRASSPTETIEEDGDVYSIIHIARERTVIAPFFDSDDRTVLERQRTAESIYRRTVGQEAGESEVAQRRPPTRAASYFSRITSRTPRDDWPQFGGGKCKFINRFRISLVVTCKFMPRFGRRGACLSFPSFSWRLNIICYIIRIHFLTFCSLIYPGAVCHSISLHIALKSSALYPNLFFA